MLDSFLEVGYVHEAREQQEKEAVALLKQLPADDLLKIASGQKLAWMSDPCGPSGSTSFLDKFKGTPLFEEALALEQEELQAEMTSVEKRKEQRLSQQEDQGLWDLQDQLRIKKRLLDLRLAQEEAGAATGGGAAPPLGTAPVMEAPGAGGPGVEAAPVEAMKQAMSAGDVVKMTSVAGKKAATLPAALANQGHSALGAANQELGHFKSLASKTAGIADKARAAKGAVGRAVKETYTMHPRSTAGAVAGGVGAGMGALEGHLRKDKIKEEAKKHPDSKYWQHAAKHPVRHLALQNSALMGTAGALGTHLAIRDVNKVFPGGLERSRAFVRRDQALRHAKKSVEQTAKHASFEPSSTIDTWGRELARADFVKAADAVAWESSAKEAGAVLAKEGAGLGGLASMASSFVKNPKNLGTLVGAGTGALGGLASGLRKDESGQRHLLGGLAQGAAGGAVGALGGHAVQNIGASVRSGTPFGTAAKQYGSAWGSKIRDASSSMPQKAPTQLSV